MNDFEKALNGYVFKKGNAKLAEMRMKAKDMCFDYNNLRPSDSTSRNEIIENLIGQINGDYVINAPFYCDYGTFVSIGKNFFSNYNCKILDGGKVKFGDNILIGPDCTFATPAHMLDPLQRKDGYEIFLPITVGNNVWFGANVTVLGGVTIGDNCVIAAGSVVTRDIPSNTLAMGVPCKVVREIDERDKKRYPFKHD